MIGSTIDGRYQIRRLLGRGGMGVVYEAHHIGLDKTIALKVIEHARATPDLVTRFQREARAASRIVHPNVVQIFDVGSADGVDYIAMEFVEGRDISKMLRDDGPFEPARAISVARQLLAGLHAIHEGGIVHRDIKPANVILSARDGEDEVVKIMDFGIAKAIDASVAITKPGHAIGTANYMAPEQVLGKDVDHRADLYSVGITLYAMLAGEAPFTGATFTRVALQQLSDHIPSLDEVRPGLPRPLVVAVARALEKAPEHRFADAEMFTAALDRELPPVARAVDARDATETVRARPATTPPPPDAPTKPARPASSEATQLTGVVGPSRRLLPIVGGIAVVMTALALWLALRERAPAGDAVGMRTAPVGALDDAAPRPTTGATGANGATPATNATNAPPAIDATPTVVDAPTPPAATDAPTAPRATDAATASLVPRAIDAPPAPRATDAATASRATDAASADDAATASVAPAAIEDAPSLAIDASTPPPRQPRAPLGTLREGPLVRCACVAEGRSLCKDVGPLLCKCAAPEGELCSVPFVKCTPGQCEYLTCKDSGYGGFKYAAKPDSTCTGYIRATGDRGERLFTGTYQCGYCSNVLRYDGAPGDPCEGFELETGKPLKGYLNCPN